MAGLTTDNIKDPMAAAVSTALLAATHSVNIKPFKPIGTDKFEQTVSWKRWIGHFDKLIAPLTGKTDDEKAAMLLIAIGEEAEEIYDRQTEVTTEGNSYKNARKRLENAFCVPNAEGEARVRFFAIRPKPGERTLQLIDRFRQEARLANFTNTDHEIMRLLMSMVTDNKWQERRFSQNWTHEHLADAELYARQLEQNALLKKQLAKQYGSGGSESSKIQRIQKGRRNVQSQNANKNQNACSKCGRSHAMGQCPAFNHECFRCHQKHHFKAQCPQNSSHRGRSQYRGRFNHFNKRGNYSSGNSNFSGNSYRGGGRSNYRGRFRGRGRGRGGRVNKVNEQESYPAQNYDQQPQSQRNHHHQENQYDSFVSAVKNIRLDD